VAILEVRCQTLESHQNQPDIFRKIEQVKRREGVLKSSTPKDTEVNAITAARISDPKPKPLR
jgi:hypothetical protein